MEIRHVSQDPHIIAALLSLSICQMLAQSLPNGDISDDLEEILDTTQLILSEFTYGRHFGSKAIDEFVLYLDSIKRNFEEYKKCH